MKRNKIILTTSLIVIFTAALCITGISAYFTAIAHKENVTSAGNNEITIEETFSNPDIEPNTVTELTKRVTVKNTGINCAGIRIRAEFSEKTITDWVDIDYNESDWTKDGDYWYYNNPVEPGEETAPLFTKLTCNNPTAEQVRNFDVYLYSESRNCEADTSFSIIKTLFN